MWWLWMACAPAPSTPAASWGNAPSIPPRDWQDTGGQPLLSGSWESVSVVSDMTGDGIHDLLVSASYGSSTFVIPGPLRGRSTIDVFAEATGVIVHEQSWVVTCLQFGDLDGDGLTDVLSWMCYGGTVRGPPRAVLAPVVGQVHAAQFPPYDGLFGVDLDGDRALERVRLADSGRSLSIFEPSVRGGAPILTLGVCEEDDPAVPSWLDVLPDIDGDGMRELYWRGRPDHAGGAKACSNFWLPAAIRGKVNANVATDRRSGPVFEVYGDLTGDGWPEVWAGASLLAGPVDLSGPQVQGVALRGPWSFDMRRVPFDLDGDGLGELERRSLDGRGEKREIVSLRGGRDQVLAEVLSLYSGGEITVDYAVEDGVALAARIHGDWAVGVDELGPATAVGLRE